MSKDKNYHIDSDSWAPKALKMIYSQKLYVFALIAIIISGSGWILLVIYFPSEFFANILSELLGIVIEVSLVISLLDILGRDREKSEWRSVIDWANAKAADLAYQSLYCAYDSNKYIINTHRKARNIFEEKFVEECPRNILLKIDTFYDRYRKAIELEPSLNLLMAQLTDLMEIYEQCGIVMYRAWKRDASFDACSGRLTHVGPRVEGIFHCIPHEVREELKTLIDCKYGEDFDFLNNIKESLGIAEELAWDARANAP